MSFCLAISLDEEISVGWEKEGGVVRRERGSASELQVEGHFNGFPVESNFWFNSTGTLPFVPGVGWLIEKFEKNYRNLTGDIQFYSDKLFCLKQKIETIAADGSYDNLETLEEFVDGMMDDLEAIQRELKIDKEVQGELFSVVDMFEEGLDDIAYLVGKMDSYSRGEVRISGRQLLKGLVVSFVEGEEQGFERTLDEFFFLASNASAEEIKPNVVRDIQDEIIDIGDDVLGSIDEDKGGEGRITVPVNGWTYSLGGEISLTGERFSPGRRSQSKFDFGLTGSGQGWEGSVETSLQTLDYKGSLFEQKNYFKREGYAEFDAWWGISDWNVWLRIGDKFYPNSVDDVIPRRETEEASKKISWLVEELNRRIPLLAGIFLPKLDEALTALNLNCREEAVDILEDLLDLVRDKWWEGMLQSSDARWLIAQVKEILPREKNEVLSGGMGIVLPVRSGAVELREKIKRQSYPTDPERDYVRKISELEIQRTIDRWSLNGTLATKEKQYVYSNQKSYYVREYGLRAKYKAESWYISYEIGEQTEHSYDGESWDELNRAQEVVAGWSGSEVDFKASYSRDCEFENGRFTAGEFTDEFQFRATGVTEEGKIKLTFSTTDLTLGGKSDGMRREKTDYEIELSGEIKIFPRLVGFFSVEREIVIDWAQRSDDRDQLTLEGGFEYKF